MKNYYSQHGEDFLLNEIFKKKKHGFFVEVGCIDGKRFSNTLTFEMRGWNGLCVEAHKDYIELLEKNRPNSIVVHCAVGEKDEDGVSFFANARGSLSTLDRSLEKKFKKRYGKWFTGFEKQVVNKRSLNTIFENNKITEIDILSIDIEGSEVEALKGINFDKYKPYVIVIESDSRRHQRKIERILNPAGYNFITRLNANIFYSIDENLRDLIHNMIFTNIQLIHTEHPLDDTGDEKVVATIDTRRKSNKIDTIAVVFLKKALKRLISVFLLK